MSRPALRCVLALALIAALAGCAAQEPGRQGSLGAPLDPARIEALKYRPAFQKPIRPRYPSAETPRLTPLGDFDTPRDYAGRSWRHRGLDIVGESGDPVIAVAPGRACQERDEINGLSVVLYPRIYRGNGPGGGLLFATGSQGRRGEAALRRHALRIRYAHLRRVAERVRPCGEVAMGDVLGQIGTSGIASTPHLHFEIVAADPSWLPGDPLFAGGINPLTLMRRDPGQPLGTITCYAPNMRYRPNRGDREDTLTIVWPTLKC